MFANKESVHPLYDFLKTLQHKGRPLMINKRIRSGQQLDDALSLADRYLESESDTVHSSAKILSQISCSCHLLPTHLQLQGPTICQCKSGRPALLQSIMRAFWGLQTPVSEVLQKMEELGFERGWGRDRARIRETIGLLLDILEVCLHSCSSSACWPSNSVHLSVFRRTLVCKASQSISKKTNVICLNLHTRCARQGQRTVAARDVSPAIFARLVVFCKQAPDSQVLENFLGRLPLNFNVAILSPHGFFG